MNLVADTDVLAVAEFMQTQIAASRLVAVANGVAAIAPILWGTYQRDAIDTLRLEPGRVCQVVEKLRRVIIRRDDVTTLPFVPPSYPDSHRAFAV